MLVIDLDWINRVIVSLGLPTVFGGLIYVGRKLQKLDDLGETIKDEIKPGLQDVRERFSRLEGKFTGFTISQSPEALTPKAEKLLQESGLKEYIDTHQTELLEYCKANFKMDTAYDIQEAIFDYFQKLEFEPEFEKKLKEHAFNNGTSMEIVRRIGAIYFRDICLAHFKKDASEIDKQKATA